jgi:hypothetical protein
MNGRGKAFMMPPNASADISRSAITSEIAQDMKSDRLTPITQGPLVHGSSRPELVHSLAAAGRTSVTITGLKLGDSDAPDQTITINDVTANATFKNILKEISNMGKYICFWHAKFNGTSLCYRLLCSRRSARE